MLLIEQGSHSVFQIGDVAVNVEGEGRWLQPMRSETAEFERMQNGEANTFNKESVRDEAGIPRH